MSSSSNPSHPTPTNPTFSHFSQQSFPQQQYRQNTFSYPTKADIFGPSANDPLVRYELDAYQDSPLAPKHVVSYSAQILKQQQQQQQQQQSQPQQPPPVSQQSFVANGGVPYLNGAHLQNGVTFSHPHAHHHHHSAQQSLLHAPGPGSSNLAQTSSSQQVSAQPPSQQNNRNDQSQEEISTIFVVGFPDDMQEREFQNMFTFSNGFEAATLKIPNKDSSAYSSTVGASGATNTLRQAGYLNQQYPTSSAYPGAQDPYNLVTVNSGGVVVDGPQGTSSSWQHFNSADSFGVDLQQQPQQVHPPPRKQIIGFAKFRSRQEALEARDILQGRRVDIEKGAVLKAEMAKKNLHTKRGVGPLGLPVGLLPSAPTSTANVTVPSVISANPTNHALGSSELSGTVNSPGFAYTNGTLMGLVSPPGSISAGELTVRDRQLGTLDAMGLGVNSLNRRQQHPEEEKEHDQREKRALSISTATTSTVTRDEQDQEEITRRDQELAERNLRSTNPTLYDAFHLVSDSSNLINGGINVNGGTPHFGLHDSTTTFPGYSLHAGNNSIATHGALSSLASTLHGSSFSGSGGDVYSPSQVPQAHNSAAPGTPWTLTTPNANSLPPSSVPPRPPSSSQSSPPSSFDVPYSTEKRVAYTNNSFIDANGVISPSEFHAPLPPNGGLQILRSHSPGDESSGHPQHRHNTVYSSFGVSSPSSLPRSSSSSVADGSQGSSLGSLENDFSRTFMVSTEHGMTSPQLPSPGSGASSAGGPTATSTSTLSSTGTDGRQASSTNSRHHYPGNASDQNPPINTLYVGNLPNSLVSAGYSSTVLEDSLRSLFSQCPGYRKLCFRQKNNGPMCFVEFEDVNYATRAMHDLYGHQLNGLVKGGIRLSFSKNPLGVRPSNPNGSNQRNGQQQLSSGPHQSPITAPSNAMNFSSMHDAFQNRISSTDAAVGGGRPILRHHDSSLTLGATELGSPTHIYSYTVSSPPTSRFFSPPPSTLVNAVGPGSGAGVTAASGNTASSSMSSASSTSSATSASGTSSVPGLPGPSFSGNLRSTGPFSPTLSAQAHSPSIGMNVQSPSALETDDRAVRFARSPPVSTTSQVHSFGAPGSSLAPLSPSNGAVSPGLDNKSFQ